MIYICIYMWYIYICIYIYYIFFIHSTIDGYLGSFHILAIVNNAAMNIGGAWIFWFSQIYIWEQNCRIKLGSQVLSWVSTESHWKIIKNRRNAAAAAKLLQSCLTLCNPIDGSPSGSAVPGILQARTLEWVAIFFSNAWKWKVKVKSLSHVQLSETPWTAACQAPPSMGFSRQEYWSGVPLPSLNRRNSPWL